MEEEQRSTGLCKAQHRIAGCALKRFLIGWLN